MLIIKGNKISKNKYSTISNDDNLSEKKFILFDIPFWKKNSSILKKSKSFLGIKFNLDEPFEFIFDETNNFKLIQIEFLTFKDGRPFSAAKKLKKIFKYRNEIRASGYILPDQYIFLIRSGFDSVEIKNTQKNEWLRAYRNDVGLYYQN